eukprot:4570415-Prymnesium_polylepis.1
MSMWVPDYLGTCLSCPLGTALYKRLLLHETDLGCHPFVPVSALELRTHAHGIICVYRGREPALGSWGGSRICFSFRRC